MVESEMVWVRATASDCGASTTARSIARQSIRSNATSIPKAPPGGSLPSHEELAIGQDLLVILLLSRDGPVAALQVALLHEPQLAQILRRARDTHPVLGGEVNKVEVGERGQAVERARHGAASWGVDSLMVAKKALAGHIDIDIIVGDTGSTEAALLQLYDRLAGDIAVIRDMAYQFSRCNNDAFDALANRDLVLFLNNDVSFPDATEALSRMVRHLRQSPSTGTLGAVLHYPDGNCQHGGIDMIDNGPFAGLCFHPGHGAALTTRQDGDIWPVMAVTGACLMMPSALFVDIGGFDEAYRTECQDVALCLAARRRGFGSEIMHAGKIIHLENATRPQGSEDWQDRQRFVRKWRGFMEAIR